MSKFHDSKSSDATSHQWSRDMIAKLTSALLVKKFPAFCVTYSGPCSQKLDSGSYSEPFKFSPHTHTILLEDLD
jgi:hypothetical protein